MGVRPTELDVIRVRYNIASVGTLLTRENSEVGDLIRQVIAAQVETGADFDLDDLTITEIWGRSSGLLFFVGAGQTENISRVRIPPFPCEWACASGAAT